MPAKLDDDTLFAITAVDNVYAATAAVPTETGVHFLRRLFTDKLPDGTTPAAVLCELSRLLVYLLGQNPLGEWGRADSPNVNVRGIRDYSYLVMKRHGSPMHFCEVAKTISQTFDKKAHTATCHNELIKDPRFVLVGRGTYGLSEWGYKPGVARDVIAEILKKEGPMKKEEIIDHVMKERFLKKNTILVNLQNSKYFKKTKDGLYAVA